MQLSIGLLETKEVLESMISRRGLTAKEVEVVERALREVEITIDNGDESNW